LAQCINHSTAGLFDVKATPLDSIHPGVEILATATDNLKNDDYLRVPDMKFLNLALALLIVWATAWAFYKSAGQETLDKIFGASHSSCLSGFPIQASTCQIHT
jgi:adenylate cyclase